MVPLGMVGYDLDCGGLFVGDASIIRFYWSLCTKGKKVVGGLPRALLLHVCGMDDLDLLSVQQWDFDLLFYLNHNQQYSFQRGNRWNGKEVRLMDCCDYLCE